MSARKAPPYRVGERAQVLHSTAAGATVLGDLEITRVTELATNGQWRITMPRTGGGTVEAIVGRDGRDSGGYVQPARVAS